MSEVLNDIESYKKARRPKKIVTLPGDGEIQMEIQRLSAGGYSAMADLIGPSGKLEQDKAPEVVWHLCQAGIPMFAEYTRDQVKEVLTFDDATFLAGQISDFSELNESNEDLAKNSASAQDSDSS